MRVLRIAIVSSAAREAVLKIIRIEVGGQDELANITHAGSAMRALLGRAQHRKQQRCKDGDDGDHNQQFDERKGL